MKSLDEFSQERFKTPSKRAAVVLASFLVLLLIVFVLNPFVIVKAGHRGVVLNFGAVSKDVLERP
ncbi:MAG: hypothetical protein QMD01_01495 [Thermodesulfovibrionales bacterium]|nr:hypothetical protein [Thermodesulfovibrionales bacterium]